MKQKIFNLLLIVLLAAAIFGVKTEAEETTISLEIQEKIACVGTAATAAGEEIELIDSGYCGNTKVMWGLTTDGVLVITGNGRMPDYPYGYTPWGDYREDIYAVVVTGDVKYIGEYSLGYCANLEVARIEKGVTQIGDRVFQYCEKLNTVDIPDTVTSIGEGAFSGCTRLKSIKLPAKIKTIEERTFSGCFSLKSLSIPNGVTQIGPYAFENCSSMTSIQIPKTVTVIEDSAFRYCTGFTTFTFPASVKVIENGTFDGCTRLKTINIPSGVTLIEGEAFRDCTALEKISLPNTVTEMYWMVFWGCTNLKTVDLPDYITKIPQYTFENCKHLKSITIPDGVKTIDSYAFRGCYSLTSCYIPNSVENIGEMAFSSCDNLVNIRIPESVTRIENFAFQHCKKLEKVSVLNPDAIFGTKGLPGREIFKNSPNVLIRCLENSTAQEHAVLNGIPYELIDLSLVEEYFADVYKDWYTDYVQYVYDRELMTGMKGTDKFEPNANITKAQVAQVLYNMEGQPEVEEKLVFSELTDVYEAEWYANAVAWAYETGVVTGDTNAKKFFPNADVTREQLALMMYRYAQYKEYDTSASDDLSNLVHAENVSNWAADGVKWAVGAGLISGIEKNGVKDLAPQGNASRAQVAAILMRFCNSAMKESASATVLTAEKDRELKEELATQIEGILTSETEIVRSDTAVPGETYTGTAYYVSNDGNDRNDGLTPETAWQTLDKVMQVNREYKLQSGDAVFFRRGDIFRLSEVEDGDSLNIRVAGVTYSAYGEGGKPIITASSENGTGAEKWKLVYEDETGKKIWQYYRDMRDVSRIVLNDGEVITSRVYEFFDGNGYISCEDTGWSMHESEGVTLKEGLLPLEESMIQDFSIISRPFRTSAENNYSECGAVGPLYLRCDAGNPGELYESVEFSEYYIKAIVWLETKDVVFDNLSFRCGGNSYMKNGTDWKEISNTRIQNCEFAYGGGCVTDYHVREDGATVVGVQGDGIYKIVRNTTIQNNYFHDGSTTDVTYEGDFIQDAEPADGYYHFLNNVSVNTAGIRLDSSAEGMKYLDSVKICGNQIWNVGHMDSGKYIYSEGALVLFPNNYGECIITDNVFYGTEKGHPMNALLNFFMYNFELFTCTRPQMSGNTYVQYSGRNVADFLMQNSETWGINDSDLLKKSAELLQDTTSEFYVILEE